MRRALKPDAQPVDKIIIKTVPRFKDSELSGSEWRITAIIEFYRKGKLVKTSAASTVEYAAYLLGSKFIELTDNGEGYFAGERDICDQEGCENVGTIALKKKFDWCNQGHKSTSPSEAYRLFCERHSHRGNGGLDDGDSNYDTVNPPSDVQGA